MDERDRRCRVAGWWLLCAALPACAAGHFVDQTYRDGDTAYRVGFLGTHWQQRHVRGGNLAFVNDQGGTILANSTCTGIKDLPLDVLLNQELFGVEERVEQSREALSLDGRAALRARLTGTVDGVRVALDLVVLKKDGCTYDLGLIAPETEMLAREPDFWDFVSGFRELGRGG